MTHSMLLDLSDRTRTSIFKVVPCNVRNEPGPSPRNKIKKKMSINLGSGKKKYEALAYDVAGWLH